MVKTLLEPPRPQHPLKHGVLRQTSKKLAQSVLPLEASIQTHLLRSSLSGPLRLRVQSRSRMRLRIAVSIAFFFFYFKGVGHYSATIARLSRLSGLERGGWELLPVRGCEIGRDRAFQSRSLSQRGSYSGRGTEAEIVWHSTGWGGH